MSGFLSVSEEKAPKTEANCSHITTFEELTENTTYTHKIKLVCVILTSWAREGVSTTATTHSRRHRSSYALPVENIPEITATAASDDLHYLLLSAERC